MNSLTLNIVMSRSDGSKRTLKINDPAPIQMGYDLNDVKEIVDKAIEIDLFTVNGVSVIGLAGAYYEETTVTDIV